MVYSLGLLNLRRCPADGSSTTSRCVSGWAAVWVLCVAQHIQREEVDMHGHDSSHNTVRTSRGWRQRRKLPPGLMHATTADQALVRGVHLRMRALLNVGTLAFLACLDGTLQVSFVW